MMRHLDRAICTVDPVGAEVAGGNNMSKYEDRVGYELPGGHYRVSAHERWLANDAMCAPQTDDDQLHPMFLYFAAIRGMGCTLQEFFALFDASADDGPMLGETEITQDESMRVDEQYEVRARVTAVQRKTSKRVGVMDLVTARFDIVAASGTLAGSCTSVFVFPRKSS